MVYEGFCRFLFIVGLLIIVSPVTWSAESDFPHSDSHIDDGSQHTRFRDKRTLDFILHGLAQMLGYRLQRNSAQTATTASPPPPPAPPPTQPSKLTTQTAHATPSQIVFLSLSDVDLRRKQTATESLGHSADSDRKKQYPYGRYRIAPDFVRSGHNERSNRYYTPDFSHVGYDGPYHIRGGYEDDRNSHYVRMGFDNGRGDSDHGKDGRKSDGSHYSRSRHRNDTVDEYFERIGHYIKDQLRGGKGENKIGHNSEKSNQFKKNGASKLEGRGGEAEQDKEHVRSEYSIKGSDGAQDSSIVSGGQHNGGHDANATQIEQKEDTNKSDDDHGDKASNEVNIKSPENTEEKEVPVQKFQQENNKQESQGEEEQSQQPKQEVSENENVEHEHANNAKEKSNDKDSIDHNEGEQSKQEEGRKEEKHREGANYNQIPAPSLQTWVEDFWNSRHSFADNSPYSFGLFDSQRSRTDEQKDLHTIPEFSFHTSTDKDSRGFKPTQPEPYYHRPQYFDTPGYELVNEWHVSSGRQSEKPSFGSGIRKESSEPQGEFKEEQETSDSVSDSPADPSGNTAGETPESSQPSTHRQDVTDSSPMPVHSTSKPKLAQLIHEMEGTKQNPLWPPPFDHAFESTDSSIVTHRPKQSDATSVKKVPGHISPFLLNLYNYTSVSDYLLDGSKKGLLPKQAYQFSQEHTKSDYASQNQKSPVSYIALVIPNQSKKNIDNSVPPEPSFVGVVYPQRLLDEGAKETFGLTSTKSNSIKNNKTPRFKPLTKSLISNLTQKAPSNSHDEIQDPPLETQYKPLYHGSSSALESIESGNVSGGHIHSYPDPYVTPFFQNPETHSNTNTLPYTITSESDYRTSDVASEHAKNSAKNAYHYPGNIYDNPLFYNPEARSVSNVPLQGLSLGTGSSNNFSLHGHNEKLQHGIPFYWLSFQDSEGSHKASAQTEKSSSSLESGIPTIYDNEQIYDYSDTYSSVLQNNGGNLKTNASREGSSSALNFRHPSNSSENIYGHIKDEKVNDYPDAEYRIFQNTETQLLGSPVSHSFYNNYQDYQGDKVYNPSPFSADGGGKSLSITKPLRLVIPDLQPHTTPSSQSPKLRVVIPDFPQSESSLDYSSGSEQNELKNAAIEDNVGLMTIPPPTPYIDDPGSVKNPEKWVLGVDMPNSKNLKTKEYIRRVSKVHVTEKVQKQPKTNLETV